MAKKKRKSLAIQRWMDSENGQMFMNYAYSWGASIVILGALFKLTHLPGADIMLFIGMGTEVLVFFISGFERQYDKTEDKPEVETLAVAANQEPAEGTAEETEDGTATNAQQGGTVIIGGGVPAGGTVVIGGGMPSSGNVAAATSGGTVILGGNQHQSEDGESTESVTSEGASIDAAALANSIATSPVMTASTLGMTPEMAEATEEYVSQLKNLTEVLNKVAEQSTRLTRDSEEMENMNRTLTGINSIYEIQLRSVSAQIGTIDEINAQTKRLAEQIAELNEVYARMLEALKVNMKQ